MVSITDEDVSHLIDGKYLRQSVFLTILLILEGVLVSVSALRGYL